ncbi:MAG: DUF2147 domain-containing protein, partial [Alphaproteobacteria bacterium]|nr:DUF2147 domain-containing protein [Alphaproteobacteria bacterium]
RACRFVFYATFFLGAAMSHGAAASDVRISGDWSRADGEARITIAPCGERLCATNTWIKDPGKGELVGDRFVMSLRPQQPAVLAGDAFDIRRGATYSIRISFDRDAMTTRGCIVGGIVCRTVSWVRVP